MTEGKFVPRNARICPRKWCRQIMEIVEKDSDAAVLECKNHKHSERVRQTYYFPKERL